MKKYVVIEKAVGETPLSCAEKWRSENGVSPDVPLAYAGRLDPMASGKLLVLIGEECKRQKEYHSLDKEYQFEILFGFESDTGDVLGMGDMVVPGTDVLVNNQNIRALLPSLLGTHTFKYPKFSSKTVRGIPLHEWNFRGGVSNEEIPTYEAQVKKITFHSLRTISAHELHAHIEEKIHRLPEVTDPKKSLGRDFRRGEILPRWAELLNNRNIEYQIARFTAIVSSGMYIRTLAPDIARQLGTSGLAFSIHRTKIGRYFPATNNFGIWWKKM